MKKPLNLQRRLAASILKAGRNRVTFNKDKLKESAEAITRADVRGLIIKNAISKKPKKGVSRVRARKLHEQKKKGRRKGIGSRKGTWNARTGGRKRRWINKIRTQRELLKELRDKEVITPHIYRKLYRIAKSGYFRTRAHLKLYISKEYKKDIVDNKKEAKQKKKGK